MKSKIVIIISFCFTLFSCDSYLDKQPDDMQTLEGVFEKRSSTEQYLANVLNYLPHQWDNVCTLNGSSYGWPFTPASDEAEWGAVRVYAQMQNGTHSAASPAMNFWSPLYRGIRESNIFLQNVGRCTELKNNELELWTAEARYANIMCHYWLAILYGPIVLVKDEVVDVNETIYRERDTWEECVTWITESLKEVAEKLPARQEDIYVGKPTKTAALAYRSRLLLYSASELMNGNSFFSSTTKEDGTPLFPKQVDANKWRIAANAAKEIIDMCESGILPYGLYTSDSEEQNKKGITYKKVFTENWNKELLDAKDMGDDVYHMDLTPAPNGERFKGHATACVTQQQVDAYAMNNGKYPITGYTSAGRPLIDESSGYSEEGFSTFTVPTFDSSNSGYTGEAFNMYKGREPRFYASVGYNEGVWPNTSTDKPIYLNKYGTEGPSSSDYNRTGYLVTKFTHPASTINPYALQWRRCWPNFRYAEILLNYVEAKIELGETRDALPYWNMVRKRAGVPDIDVVYPSVASDKELATFLIRRERQVEFAFENVRWFDANRWKISTKTNHGKAYGMNINISSLNSMRDEYYVRTAFETRVFKEAQYLQPIPQSSIVKNPKLVQNPGW
ncbi:RagB/SusD family nutrient uptake outer membrane protein [Parabacteroides sp. OttesenSCG-928-J18]|nr:RagB/SusD family nutrient uptake outer membrane protein [Parabacteroides sp. OttesenSCG-928-J18]